MKHSPRRFSTLIVAAVLILSRDAILGQARETFRGRVVSISDGDTIGVLRDGREVPIRLLGIDCPEAGQSFASRAKSFTTDLVSGKIVELDVHEVDRYGRLVARVTVNGRDLGLSLVRAGLAWHYTQASSDPLLAAAERDARTGKLGLWAEPKSIPPWAYRSSTAPPRTARSAPLLPFANRAAAVEYRGNIESKVFHGQACEFFRCRNCTVMFKTADEARDAGYRPHRDCVR